MREYSHKKGRNTGAYKPRLNSNTMCFMDAWPYDFSSPLTLFLVGRVA